MIAAFKDWISRRLSVRPLWMNLLMFVCLYMTFIYVPFDFFIKPIEEDAEAWFGVLVYGRMAKVTEPVHWIIYALGSYGFWRMRPWMWPWASVYTAQLTLGMFAWPIAYIGGAASWAMGFVSAVFFGGITLLLWRARDHFLPARRSLRDRYGDWALVTGASAGIGLEFARAFAERGINVVLVARRADRLRDLAAVIESEFDVRAVVVSADLATPGGADEVADAVREIPVGILVNNAGFGYAGRFDKQDCARLQEMIALNCTAPVVLTHRLLPKMLERGSGAVITVGSVAGRQPIPLHAVYSATKSFNLMFGEALWAELGAKGVDSLVLQPGPVATEFEAVAGEARSNPSGDERPEQTVATALDHLGQSPSVVSGWLNWFRANVNRVMPRSVIAFIAGVVMEKQTPPSAR
jgi:short-subunit dehydrogenase